MFLGTYRHAVDAKGRVAIPARFREQLPSGTVISKGAEGCLQVYPPQEWAQEQGLRLGSTTPAEERRLARMMFGAARECEFDAQGRIVLSADQRQYADITGVAPDRRGDARGIHAHSGPGGRAATCPAHVTEAAALDSIDRPGRPDTDPYFYKTS